MGFQQPTPGPPKVAELHGPADAGIFVRPLIDLGEVPYRIRAGVLEVDLPPGCDPHREILRAARSLAFLAGPLPELDLHVRGAGRTFARDPGLLAAFLQEASGRGLSPTRVVVDVFRTSESGVDPAPLLESLDRLRAYGVRVSLGRTSLAPESLQTMLSLRPDYFWISAEIVAGCHGDFYRRAMLESISRLAWKFGALTIAEGVSSAREASALRDLGVSFALGPWIGPPVEARLLAAAAAAGDFPFAVDADGSDDGPADPRPTGGDR